MPPKDADGIANSEDPDQTAGFALFAYTYLSENLGSLRYALFMAAVCPKDQKKLSLIMKKLVYRGFRPGCTQTQACSVT